MASIVTGEPSAPTAGTDRSRPGAGVDTPPLPPPSTLPWLTSLPSLPALSTAPTAVPSIDESLPSGILADLDDPSLVLSDGYVGPDRRTDGLWAGLRRATFAQRRSLLRLEGAVLALVVVVVAASVLLVDSGSPTHATATSVDAATARARLTDPSASPANPAATTPATTTPSLASTDPTATAPATTPPAPAAAPVPAAASAPPVTDAPPVSTAPLTPAQMGAQALALVRYPWQSIPGYTIQFQPISAAPSPGFYGNTTFTWGQTGGTSVLYVYPGETVERLAGITAFEIAHEVDAAAVQPQGGEAQIENILGIHPGSWAPTCDCAEQGYLSGWYAAAFSNYWSPGVGNWSPLAPLPTGATLAAVEPWLNPNIP